MFAMLCLMFAINFAVWLIPAIANTQIELPWNTFTITSWHEWDENSRFLAKFALVASLFILANTFFKPIVSRRLDDRWERKQLVSELTSIKLHLEKNIKEIGFFQRNQATLLAHRSGINRFHLRCLRITSSSSIFSLESISKMDHKRAVCFLGFRNELRNLNILLDELIGLNDCYCDEEFWFALELFRTRLNTIKYSIEAEKTKLQPTFSSFLDKFDGWVRWHRAKKFQHLETSSLLYRPLKNSLYNLHRFSARGDVGVNSGPSSPVFSDVSVFDGSG